MGDILSATFEKRQTSGEAAELQKHFGFGARTKSRSKCCGLIGESSERAAATVPASIGDASVKPQSLRRFSLPATARSSESSARPCQLVTLPIRSCPLFQVLKGRSPGQIMRPRLTLTFVANNLSPERLQASFSYRRTDAARFAGLDASLRLALNGGLQERLDQQAINGSDGLLNGTNLDNNNVSATTTFALYLVSGLLYGRV